MSRKKIFEGTVQFDSWVAKHSDPPQVVFDVQYPLPSIPIIQADYNPLVGKIEEKLIGYNDFGLMHLTIPGNFKVKSGQKIIISIE